MANEMDLWNDLEQAEKLGLKDEVKRIKKELIENYPDLRLSGFEEK